MQLAENKRKMAVLTVVLVLALAGCSSRRSSGRIARNADIEVSRQEISNEEATEAGKSVVPEGGMDTDACENSAEELPGNADMRDNGDGENTDGQGHREIEKAVHGSSEAGLDSFLGEWTLGAYQYAWNGGESRSACIPVHSEQGDMQGSLVIYEDSENIRADYIFNNEGRHEVRGIDVQLAETRSGENGGASTAEMYGPDDEANCELTLQSRNVLAMRQTVESGTWTEYIFARKGSEEAEHPDDLQYVRTVRVSDISGLEEAIADRTKIIMEEGTYNFSKLGMYQYINPAFDLSQYVKGSEEIMIRNISNLCLQAADGADVQIMTDCGNAAVLYFLDCSHIYLDGLTVGHNVDPGYCAGSVIHFEQCDAGSVRNCSLYGSGTYGIEAEGVSGLLVSDTDIYDCTYGLVKMTDVSFADFTGCNLMNSRDLSMFDLSECMYIHFTDCAIMNNSAEGQPFISSRHGTDIRFSDCAFEGNRYEVLLDDAEDAVAFDGCTFLDN